MVSKLIKCLILVKYVAKIDMLIPGLASGFIKAEY